MGLFDLRLVNRKSPSTQLMAQANEMGEQLVAQGLPPYTEMSRQGNGWTVQTTTLLTPLAVYPTTLAALEIFNNTTGAASQTLVVADLFGSFILGTAVAQAWGMFGMVTTQKAVPTLTALTIASMSGKQSYVTTAASPIVTGVGTTVIANGWRPYGPPMGTGLTAATPGGSGAGAVDGKLIVPPGCSLCVHIVAAVATASSFQCGASVYWAPITAPVI